MSAGELPESAVKERRTHAGYARKLAYTKRWRGKNKERIAEHERDYKAEYYRFKRAAILADRKADYAARRETILAQQKAGRLRHKAEEQRIAKEMEAIEREATKVFTSCLPPVPHPARNTGKSRGRKTATPGCRKRIDKRPIGTTHAETVRLRLAARNGPVMLPESEDVSVILRAARRKREQYGA